MQKIAVIVVGSHLVGKSKTINEFFKPMVGLSRRQQIFPRGRVMSQSLEERNGRVLSQSLEERDDNDVKEFVRKYANFQYFVCAARPDGENPSLYKKLKAELESKGFKVNTVKIYKQDNHYKEKAKEILYFLTLKTNQTIIKNANRIKKINFPKNI